MERSPGSWRRDRGRHGRKGDRGGACLAEPSVRRQDSIRSEKEPGEEVRPLREVAGAGEGVRGRVPLQGL